MSLFLCIIVAAGCGGGGTSVPNPLAGSYIGTWDAPSVPDTGTANATLSASNVLAATTHDNGGNVDGTINGTVSATGVVSATVHYSGTPDAHLSGVVSLNGSNHLVGNLTESVNGNSFGVTFDLVKQ